MQLLRKEATVERRRGGRRPELMFAHCELAYEGTEFAI